MMSESSELEVIKRLANDHLAFVAFLDDVPAAFGWMARGKARIGELNHDLILPIRNLYLWNFKTLPSFRGKNIYPLLLQYILKYEAEKADRFWIIHAPENNSSLRGIRKAGFRYAGKLILSQKNIPTLKYDNVSSHEIDLIQFMGIEISEHVNEGCWGCHSPYVKNKPVSCCCSEAGELCNSL